MKKHLLNRLLKDFLLPDSKLLTLQIEKSFKIVWFKALIMHALIIIKEATGAMMLNGQSFKPAPNGLSLHP